MVDFDIVLAGLADAFQLTNLLFVLAGVILGQFVGAVPGIGPVMAMAIAIPFTFVLNPLPAIGFLVGVSKGGLVGGAVPAVLINTPGTPDAAATALDGHPLAMQGKPVKATKMALYASVTGDTFSDLVLVSVSAPLAIVALKMGPVEVFALMIFAFSVIAGLVGNSLSKGIIAAALGLLCATVGLDPEHSTPRLYFGWFELYDGLPLASVAIGMLAISEILRRLASSNSGMKSAIEIPDAQNPDDMKVRWAEYWGCRFTMIRGAVIGTILGRIARHRVDGCGLHVLRGPPNRPRDDPQSFGKGNLHGIAAAESANSAVVGANLIPLLTLGIPGSVGAALIISAFMIHGIQPGTPVVRAAGATDLRTVRRDDHGEFHQPVRRSGRVEVLDLGGPGAGIRDLLVCAAALHCRRFDGDGRSIRRDGHADIRRSRLSDDHVRLFGGHLHHRIFPGAAIRDLSFANSGAARR